ncbi:MAG TPA: FAD-binding oxidoreductase [Candidatus Paceibacterota bacterium]
MRKNLSPWLHQLDSERIQKKLNLDIGTDVAIVGAGIAGTATAFFTLKYTDKKVVLLERFKLAHGATGHNAGQVVSYFERGFAGIVEEFGPELAADGQRAIDDAWELMDEMYTGSGLDIPFSRFTGYAGLTTLEQIVWNLQSNFEKRRLGLSTAHLRIARSSGLATQIPAKYEGLYEVVAHEDVLRLLETERPEYIAVILAQKGVINSALFCQEVIGYLLRTYPDRFSFFEHTNIHKVILRHDHAILDAETHTVTAWRIVLCTNGFKDVHILNETGLDIDAKYHHLVIGKVGYMSGYLEKMNKLPIEISYYNKPGIGLDHWYYYLTRRPFEYEKGHEHNLVSLGGFDTQIDETTPYSREDEYPDEIAEKMDEFIHEVYSLEPNHKIEYVFTWHGLMGYTANGVRLIGPEPQNPTLLYNLGCNGVGILPSVYGGRKIARHLAGEKVPKSMFDVPARPVRNPL